MSKSAVDVAVEYIANQKEHHKRLDFQTEFLELLRKHGIKFEEAEVFK